MPDTKRIRMIKARKRIEADLEELVLADDPDLWEEAAAKLCDVMVVYRRAVKNPEMATMSDEQRAQVAFRDAVEGFLLKRGSISCSLREGSVG